MLENKLFDIFITKEEDNIQDIYIQENRTKLAWLANQPNYIGMGRREASALVYQAVTISNTEAIKNVKAILTHQQKNSTIDLNRQTP